MDAFVALAAPKQKPAAHGAHDDADTAVTPPAEKVPGRHASVAGSVVPPGKVVGTVAEGQK
jgi:hypothetical protein